MIECAQRSHEAELVWYSCHQLVGYELAPELELGEKKRMKRRRMKMNCAHQSDDALRYEHDQHQL